MTMKRFIALLALAVFLTTCYPGGSNLSAYAEGGRANLFHCAALNSEGGTSDEYFQPIAQELNVLRSYGLITRDQSAPLNLQSDGLPADALEQRAEYNAIMAELAGYSSEKANIFLDLPDTLKKYGESHGKKWQRRDLLKLAWSLKAIDTYIKDADIINQNNENFITKKDDNFINKKDADSFNQKALYFPKKGALIYNKKIPFKKNEAHMYNRESADTYNQKETNTYSKIQSEISNKKAGLGNLTLIYGGETGIELEVLHSYGNESQLYKNPFKHDLDGDGIDDTYDTDEYMRQYLRLQGGISGRHLDAAVNLHGGVNYFGTGFIGNERQYDFLNPSVENVTFSLYSPNFMATIGEKQILGFTDYLYYHDSAKPDSYNINGLTFVAPYGIFFGLGQDTILHPEDPAKTHDTRWIATGTEGLGFLPVNLYLMEQEIQSPNFHKIGRNVVFALTTDLTLPGVTIDGDLAANDSGDGMYAQLSAQGQLGKLKWRGKVENSEHFTPIQPKVGFANGKYTRTFIDHSQWEFDARTERGYEFEGNYALTPTFALNTRVQDYLNAKDVSIWANYQPWQNLHFTAEGQRGLAVDAASTLMLETTYAPYGKFSVRKQFDGEGDWSITAEPTYSTKQLTLKGLFGYAKRPSTGASNQDYNLELVYHPGKSFTFTAQYGIQQMGFGAEFDTLGYNIYRKGKIAYNFTDTISANVDFENVDFRGPAKPYLVEYTKATLKIQF